MFRRTDSSPNPERPEDPDDVESIPRHETPVPPTTPEVDGGNDGPLPGHLLRTVRYLLSRLRAVMRLAGTRTAATAALTWLRAACTARSSTRPDVADSSKPMSGGLHRVHPRMRVLQLGTTTLAVGVLALFVGGVGPADPGQRVDPATESTTLADDGSARPDSEITRWAHRNSARTGVPARALQAYVDAAHALHRKHPGCGVPWSVLAGIGRVESDHGRFGGAVLLDSGLPSEPIIGTALDGSGVQSVTDTDNGKLDGDKVHDRAVGPMQFIPTTWQTFSTDGNGDGVTNPQSLDDAAATAGNYLCSSVPGRSLTSTANQREALLNYNQSASYGSQVLDHANRYAAAATPPPSPRA